MIEWRSGPRVFFTTIRPPPQEPCYQCNTVRPGCHVQWCRTVPVACLDQRATVMPTQSVLHMPSSSLKSSAVEKGRRVGRIWNIQRPARHFAGPDALQHLQIPDACVHRRVVPWLAASDGEVISPRGKGSAHKGRAILRLPTPRFRFAVVFKENEPKE
jgi:hypothetical protein